MDMFNCSRVATRTSVEIGLLSPMILHYRTLIDPFKDPFKEPLFYNPMVPLKELLSPMIQGAPKGALKGPLRVLYG